MSGSGQTAAAHHQHLHQPTIAGMERVFVVVVVIYKERRISLGHGIRTLWHEQALSQGRMEMPGILPLDTYVIVVVVVVQFVPT